MSDKQMFALVICSDHNYFAFADGDERACVIEQGGRLSRCANADGVDWVLGYT